MPLTKYPWNPGDPGATARLLEMLQNAHTNFYCLTDENLPEPVAERGELCSLTNGAWHAQVWLILMQFY